jgi:hypothetical protein
MAISHRRRIALKEDQSIEGCAAQEAQGRGGGDAMDREAGKALSCARGQKELVQTRESRPASQGCRGQWAWHDRGNKATSECHVWLGARRTQFLLHPHLPEEHTKTPRIVASLGPAI